MKLVISEKPSVARTIAAAIGANEKHDGYMIGRDYMVSWCVGHLIGTAMPEDYDARYKQWRYEDLPILPKEWKYNVLTQTSKQYQVLNKLMHDKRIDSIVCATDAGREGELIFRLVYEQAGCSKPVERLWISSLEQAAIEQGFRHLQDSHEYDALYQAALCREHADWLIGMNATRLYSLLYGRTLKIGRVMSPTLAMIVDREDVIHEFVPEKFYTILLDGDCSVQSERISDPVQAKQLRDQCEGQLARVTHVEKKQKREQSPKLYDLTTLQRDANRIYGYTAQQALDYTQSLYEKRLVTYPRTDSQYLTHDMQERLPELVRMTSQAFPFSAGLSLPVHPDQVINDAKVSDHHAIIPTQELSKQHALLPDGERDILTLVAVRLMCAVGDPCLYDDTTVTVECCGHTFSAKGRATTQIGWKAPWNTFKGGIGTRGTFDEEKDMPIRDDIQEGASFIPTSATVKEGVTTPPRHYTEGSILAAMENAGSKDMPEDAERKGIGTPATRSGILEKLVAEGLVSRQGSSRTKHLIPTKKGAALIAVLPQQLQSPLLTAEWELQLKQIEHAKADPNSFMLEICRLVTELKETAQRVPNAEEIFPSEHESLGKCPNCGAAIYETPKGFFCENRTCRFGLWKDNRFLVSNGKPPTKQMMQKLLSEGQIKLTGLKNKNGKTYSALLILDCAEDGSARIHPVFN